MKKEYDCSLMPPFDVTKDGVTLPSIQGYSAWRPWRPIPATFSPMQATPTKLGQPKFPPTFCVFPVVEPCTPASQTQSSSSFGAEIHHNGQYVTPSIAREYSRPQMLTDFCRVQELVPAQPVAQGAPERVRYVNHEIAPGRRLTWKTTTASRSPRPRDTPRLRVPTPSSGETTGMRSTVPPRLWYASPEESPPDLPHEIDNDMMTNDPNRRSSRRASARLPKFLCCLRAAGERTIFGHDLLRRDSAVTGFASLLGRLFEVLSRASFDQPTEWIGLAGGGTAGVHPPLSGATRNRPRPTRCVMPNVW